MHRPEYEPCEEVACSEEGSDSRQRIVRAAYPLFVDAGYLAVSMQEIADAVPLNKATLYHHFQNKDDLFLAVVRMAMRRLYGQIRLHMEAGGTCSDQLVRVAHQVFQEHESDFGRLMTDARLHLPAEMQQTLVERCADPWTLYEQIFANASETGELPQVDPGLAATMFAGLLFGQTWSVKMGRISPPLDEARAQLLVDVLFHGLRGVFAPLPMEAPERPVSIAAI